MEKLDKLRRKASAKLDAYGFDHTLVAENRRRLLRNILIVWFVAAVFVSVLAFSPELAHNTHRLIVAIMWVAGIAQLILYRMDRLLAAGWLNIAAAISTITIAAARDGGVRSPSFTMYIILFIVAWMMVGQWGAVATIVGAVASAILISQLDQAQLLNRSEYDVSDWVYISQFVMAFGAAAVILRSWQKNARADVGRIYQELTATEELQKELENFIESSLDAIIVFDKTGPIFSVNRAFEELVGLSFAEICGSCFEDFAAPEYREAAQKWRENVAKGLSVDDGVLQMTAADGTLKWVNWRMPASMPGTDRCFAVGRDVTRSIEENQNIQAQARRAQEQADSIIHIATQSNVAEGHLEAGLRVITEVASAVLSVERASIWTFGEDGQLLFCSDCFSYSTRLHSTEDAIRVADFPVYFDSIQEGRFVDADDAHTDPRTAEYAGVYLDPNEPWAILDAPVRVGGRVVGIVCLENVGSSRRWQADERSFAGVVADQVAQLMTSAARREAEAQLRRLNEELEHRVAERTRELQEKNQELETFAYSVSHDLRAPLRAIAGYNQMLKEDYGDKLDEEAIGYIERVEVAVMNMSQLIQDLLTYSRFERRTITKSPVQIKRLVNKILDELHLHASEQQVTLIVDVPDVELFTDSEGVAMALRNLIDNAAKFSRQAEEPKISIQAKFDGEDFVIEVRDNGIGFDPKYSEKIFEIFQRLERGDTYPGTGVGLAIVRKAMQRIGGSVTCESELGNGAAFCLRFPSRRPDAA